MNEADKKKLIDEVAVSQNFDPSLHDQGRRWVVDQLIRSLESMSPPTPEAAIPARVSEVVTKAKTIVAAKVNITLKLPINTAFASWKKTTYQQRLEIIYGAIATDPSLVETAKDKFLDLVIRRRYRAVARMEVWVNGGGIRPLFEYPTDDCPTLRINRSAEPLWNTAAPSVFPSGGTLPRWTIKAIGSQPLVPAIEQLWTAPAANCEGNVLECATAMSTVLMDSLLEAQDPNVFLRALRSRSQHYLAICNPTVETPNFIFDENDPQVFTTSYESIDDLQVGDYVYVQNHPLYALFQPRGDWQGEHAVVSACGNRDHLTGFKVTGHGVNPKSIHEVYQRLLGTLQTSMYAAYVVVAAFLEYIQQPVSAPDIQVEQATVRIDGQPYVANFYLFNRTFSYVNYQANPISETSQAKYLVVHIPDRQELGLHRSLDMAEALANPGFVLPVHLNSQQSVSPGEQYDPVLWGIPYVPLNSVTPTFWPLFRRDDEKLTINLIGPSDMPTPPLAGIRGAGVRIIGPSHQPTTPGAV